MIILSLKSKKIPRSNRRDLRADWHSSDSMLYYSCNYLYIKNTARTRERVCYDIMC